MAENISKNPPKGNIKFSISLSEEQKVAKAEVLNHPYNFIIGKRRSQNIFFDLKKPVITVRADELSKDSLEKSAKTVDDASAS